MLIQLDQLKDLPIASMREESRVGTIADVVIHPDTGDLVGFWINLPGFFSRRKVLSARDVVSYDPHAIVIRDDESLVDPNEVVSMVMTTHLLPDIMGNLRAYSGQSFRCTTCGASFRRIPLSQNCSECGSKLIQTLTRPSVNKYLKLAKRLLGKYQIEPYLRGRVLSLLDELELVFGKEESDQALLTDYG